MSDRSKETGSGAHVLHAAAMPFPTYQGTQAAVRSMLDVLVADGRQAHLLTYGHGEYSMAPSFRWHRLANVPRVRSVRSGPSLGKVALDVQMALRLRALHRRLGRPPVVAHHVEAAAAALAAGTRPLLFVAHTALRPELPVYGPPWAVPLAASAGGGLDRWLCRRSDAAAAVTPDLAAMLEAESGVPVRPLPIPWQVPPPHTGEERSAARRELSIDPDAEVLLYVGNLDPYQGLDLMLMAVALVVRSRPRVRLLVGSASDPAAVERPMRDAGLGGRMRFVPLAGEACRRRLHAAADLAVVPRRSPGGLPVKLLDALARGLPTVAVRRATGGLPLGAAACIAPDDDPSALAAAIEHMLASPDEAAMVGRAGRAYVAANHGAATFLRTLDELVAPATIP